MKFSESLKRNADFQNVYKNGKSYANRHLVLYVLDITGLEYLSAKKWETAWSDTE